MESRHDLGYNRRMMKRIPEPELMEDLEQAEAYDKADFSTAHNRRVELFAERYGKELEGQVLDIGCGSGDILERFAKRYPKARFTGVDGSEAMLELSRARMAKAGLASRMDFVRAFLPADPVPAKNYGVIMSHSLLHQLHHPEVLWQSVNMYAKKGTYVFIGDLRRPASAKIAQETVNRLSANEPEVLRRDFFNSLCAAFTKEEIEAQLEAAELSSLTVEEAGDIHILVHGYIVY